MQGAAAFADTIEEAQIIEQIQIFFFIMSYSPLYQVYIIISTVTKNNLMKY